MKNKKRKSSSLNVLVLLGVVIVAVALVWTGMPSKRVFVENETFEKTSDLLYNYETTRYPSNVEIISFQDKNITIGIVTDQWNLNYGIIPNGGSYGTRHLTVSNMEDRQIKVSLEVFGTIKPLISFSRNDIILNPGEATPLNVFLNTTKSTIPGNYTGEIDVRVQIPKYDFLTSLW